LAFVNDPKRQVSPDKKQISKLILDQAKQKAEEEGRSSLGLTMGASTERALRKALPVKSHKPQLKTYPRHEASLDGRNVIAAYAVQKVVGPTHAML
jgi:hypothetical protein